MKSLTGIFSTFLSLLIMLFVSSAVAVDDIEKFEMDGDAIKDGLTAPPYLGDDWDTLMNGGPYHMGTPPLVFTGIEHDHDPDDMFDGGKKDIQDISQWSWKYSTPLDKGNITHAYATAYMCPAGGFPSGCTGESCECRDDEVVTYFGADRSSNKGDTFMGFWFFKQDVRAVDGGFTNHHENGDTLVLVNFPQAAAAEPEIKVVKWESSCTKGVKNPLVGECAAKNLEMVYNGVVCHSVASDDACAITNTQVLFPNTSIPLAAGTVMAPWDYVSKNPDPNCPGAANCFPYETFFEGGINLTKLVAAGGEDTCFASFMAETRSSSEFTATLKDFSLDQFPLCALELSKECADDGVYNPATGFLEIPYSITVENTGSATVSLVDATDDVCGTGTESFTFTDVLVGTPQTQDGTCNILPGSYTPPIENGVMATASDGTAVVISDTCTTYDSEPGWCFDSCNVNLSPDIGVTKECDTRLTAENGTVEVKVLFSGVVTNTSPASAPTLLENVQVWDDNGTPSISGDDVRLTLLASPGGAELAVPVSLNYGESAYFEAYYFPSYLNAECPSAASFTNNVHATGYDAFTGFMVEDDAPATCTLCEEGNCD